MTSPGHAAVVGGWSRSGQKDCRLFCLVMQKTEVRAAAFIPAMLYITWLINQQMAPVWVQKVHHANTNNSNSPICHPIRWQIPAVLLKDFFIKSPSMHPPFHRLWLFSTHPILPFKWQRKKDRLHILTALWEICINKWVGWKSFKLLFSHRHTQS